LYKFDVILLILLNCGRSPICDHQVAITGTVDRAPLSDSLAALYREALRQKEFPMKRIALPILAVVIAIVAAAMFLRSPSTGTGIIAAEASAMMPIAEMHARIDPAKLPVEDFEDQALVFTAKQKN
jgi:hypothetical protein